VTVIVILAALGIAAFALFGVMFLVLGGFFYTTPVEDFAGIGVTALGVVLLVLAAIAAVVYSGLWNMRVWACWTVMPSGHWYTSC
jgi:hypothetical protein